MRELFFKLFEMSHFNTGIKVTPFSGAHIVYMVLIFGAIVGGYFLFRKKEQSVKNTVLRVLAYALVISYLSDFFVHDFVYASYNVDGSLASAGGLNLDKLPFHICTVLCPLVAFVQFNKNLQKFKEPVVMLAIIAPMMYICYPASIGEGEPWCYQAVQTMFYHGVLMAWGILSVCLKEVEPKFKNCWHAAILLVAITLWAKLGNLILEHNWFFLQEDAFYIGLVEMGAIPKWSLMIFNPIVFFLAVLGAYGVIIGVNKLVNKNK